MRQLCRPGPTPLVASGRGQESGWPRQTSASCVPGRATTRARKSVCRSCARPKTTIESYLTPHASGVERSLPVSEDLARRSGWITFAGVIALVAGGYNALSGIAALADDDTLADRATEVLYGIDLTAW